MPAIYFAAMRVVLIAAKQLALAKSRLAPAIAPPERARLAEAMFRDVLAAALSSHQAERVAVVTSDARLLAVTRAAGALAIDEGYPRGLNVAVALATAMLKDAGATTLCTVLSDCAMTTGSDIDAVFSAMPQGRAAVLVPSRDLTGTNIIARSPADVIGTQFGRMSLVRHRDDCRKCGVAAEVLRLSGPALDLDVVADLIEFARVAGSTHTLNRLSQLGIALH